MEINDKEIIIVPHAIIVNDVQHDIEVIMPENVTAIQWHGDSGYKEYGRNPMVAIKSLDAFASVLSVWEVKEQEAVDKRQAQTDFANSLDGKKQVKLQAISTRAKEELDKGYTVDGQTYSISANSVNGMNNKLLNGIDYTWNSIGYIKRKFVSKDNFMSFIKACYAHSEAIAQNRLRLKGLITRADTIAVLDGIDIESGWV